MTAIQDFYNGGNITCNKEELTWKQIIKKDNEWYNGCYDFIQFLFPVNKSSAYNPNAPILVKEDTTIVGRHILPNVVRFGHFLSSVDMTKFNHNHLRITRMLESLSLVIDNEASFQFFLESIKMIDLMDGYRNRQTFDYWYNATQYKW